MLGIAIPLLLTSLLTALPPVHAQNRQYNRLSNGIKYTVFEHAATNASVDYVTNSGICETTPGVTQYSGYLSVGNNMNMFFWFFEARSNATSAPLALWLNGGPGCSSMIGLFQENGPCHFVNGASTPSLNPYSFNEFANMLYVDQPIGTGFSYGTDGALSTATAAPYVWQLMQAFYSAFPQYKSRDFGLFTESYGGHYGPEFSAYFEGQNAAIAQGSVAGETIKLVALGVNNGWFDAGIQYQSYPDFAYNNTHKRLITSAQYSSLMKAYDTQCAPAMAKCTGPAGNTAAACNAASEACANAVQTPIEQANDFDVYDIRAPSDDPNPPDTYVKFLQSPAVMKAIGARQTYQECPDAPYDKMQTSGDDARSFLDPLSKVVQSGIQVLLWAGDADWICNWVGGLAVANAVTYSGTSQFASKPVAPYTVNGKSYGEFKNVGNLSWLKVFDAGHEVPYYQPEVALQAFVQTLQQMPLTST